LGGEEARRRRRLWIWLLPLLKPWLQPLFWLGHDEPLLKPWLLPQLTDRHFSFLLFTFYCVEKHSCLLFVRLLALPCVF